MTNTATTERKPPTFIQEFRRTGDVQAANTAIAQWINVMVEATGASTEDSAKAVVATVRENWPADMARIIAGTR